MAFLPADVLSEILSRLPVKPLLRFRSVCKIWCALIDSDYFVKSHLHRSIHTKNHRQITRRCHSTDFVDTIGVDDSLDVAGKQLDYPLVPVKPYVAGIKRRHRWCVGSVSCNGLELEWTHAPGDGTVIISISNPSTRKCQTLPPSQHKLGFFWSPEYHRYKVYRLGFGYDSVNDDYKVVKLTYINSIYSDLIEWYVQVYSLKSNSWRTIKNFPYEICWRRAHDGVLAHGALHFLVSITYEEERPDLSIAAFDLATEETRLVPLPDFGGGKNVRMDLVVLEGSLCIVAYRPRLYKNPKFLGVWVMKDYGVGDSWDKLLSASQLRVMGSFSKVFPLAYSKNGREVLLLRDNKEFIWFDLKHNAFRKVKVKGLPSHFRAQVCVQSLLPPGSGGNIIP